MNQQPGYVHQRGLLVPRDAAADLAAGGDGAADKRRSDLAAQRRNAEVGRENRWLQLAGKIRHRDRMAAVRAGARAAKALRRAARRDARGDAALRELYRRATREGTRARLRAEITQSGEVRALRIAAVRRTALLAGIPVLMTFAGWSTARVQHGVAQVLDLEPGTASWVGSWAVEPAIVSVVALIIVGRAVLRSNGGFTDWRFAAAEWSALTMSITLSVIGGWPADSGWQGITTALPDALGAIMAAVTAWLIGVVDEYVTRSRPWDGAPRIADINLTGPLTADRQQRDPELTADSWHLSGQALTQLTGTTAPDSGPVTAPVTAPVTCPVTDPVSEPVSNENLTADAEQDSLTIRRTPVRTPHRASSHPPRTAARTGRTVVSIGDRRSDSKATIAEMTDWLDGQFRDKVPGRPTAGPALRGQFGSVGTDRVKAVLAALTARRSGNAADTESGPDNSVADA